MISEHEQSPELEKENDSGEQYNPTDEERKTLKFIEKTFNKNKKWRGNYDAKWMNNYKMFRGQQWNEQRPSYRHSEVINLIFKAIQSSVPIITDVRPKWEYQAQEPSDREFADLMNEIAEVDWVKNNWLMALTESVYDAHLYGTGLSSLVYNPNKKAMDGDIEFESCDPYAAYPDPNSRDVNKHSCSFIKAEPTDIAVIKRDYPELGKYVKSDMSDAIRNEKTDLDPVFQLRLPIDDTKSMQSSSGNTENLLDNKCLKKIMYCSSDEQIEDPIMENGVQVGSNVRLKYPNGRKLVSAGGVLLEDGPNPYEDGKFPYSRLVNYMLPREFWGISEIEQLEHPQKIFNKLVSFSLDVLTLMGNPIWVVDHESGIDTENLVNSPGLIVEKNKGSEVRREEGVQLQPFVLQMIDRMKEWFTDISGTVETTPPPGVTAAAAIQDIQEAANTRSRLKSRYLDAYLQDLGQMYVSRVVQFRDVPTVVRVTNNLNASKYFKFHVKTVMNNGEPQYNEDGSLQKVAVVQRMGPTGGYMGQQEIPIKGNLDVKVSTGSAMPFMRAKQYRQGLELFDRQIIDQVEMLKLADLPNADIIIERMTGKAQQDAQMQQQQQQQQMAADGQSAQADREHQLNQQSLSNDGKQAVEEQKQQGAIQRANIPV